MTYFTICFLSIEGSWEWVQHAYTAWGQHYGVLAVAWLITLFLQWGTLAKEWPKLNWPKHLIQEGLAVFAILLIFYYGTHVQRNNDSDEIQQVRIERDQTDLNQALTEAIPHIRKVATDQTGVVSALNQEVTAISIRTFELIRDSDPTIGLRNISLFLGYLGKDPEKSRAIQIVDVGEAGFGRESFPLKSFAGATITGKRRKSCPDVSQRFEDVNCQPFFESPAGPLDFSSIICFPIPDSYGVPGSICMDSHKKHAFDDKEVWLQDIVDKDTTVLATMLGDFKKSPSYIAYKLSFNNSGLPEPITTITKTAQAKR